MAAAPEMDGAHGSRLFQRIASKRTIEYVLMMTPPRLEASSPVAPKNCGLAVVSLVLGVVGLLLLLVCLGPFFAIPAVVCGHLAYSRIQRSGGALEGQSLALAGLITGYACIALSAVLLPLLATVAIPNFVKARQVAQANACINNLRQIEAAKQQWALEKRKTLDDTPLPRDLDPYIRGGFAGLRCPAGGTYTINKVGQDPTCTVPGHALPGD
jgi:hypothetical protein